jgi:hypothetical protein
MLAAVAAVVAPFMASAAVVLPYDVNVGVNYAYAQVISPGGDVEFKFTVLDDVKIASFAVTGAGTGSSNLNAENDVRDIMYGFALPATDSFSTVMSNNNTAFGGGFLPGGTFKAGTSFSIFFQDGIINDVALGLSFKTTPVPLPAAGMLLAPVLVAGGIAAARRRKAKASEV